MLSVAKFSPTFFQTGHLAKTFVFEKKCAPFLILDLPSISHEVHIGGPEGIRTLDSLIKSQVLYLAELQAHYVDSFQACIWGAIYTIIKAYLTQLCALYA